jgi:hypothetical protein
MAEERKILKQESKVKLELNMLPKEDDIRAVQYDDPQLVKEVETLYPEMTDEFKRIMFTQYELFCAKQFNYGPTNISVGTRLETDEEVKLSLTGLWFRMNDKIQRLKQLVVLGSKDTVGEAIEDTYSDLSVYGIIAQIVSNKKWGK